MKCAFNYCLAGVCVLLSSAHAELRVDLYLESYPSYRGILQATDHNPVPQGLVEYVSESGLYAGAWASRLQTDLDDRDSQVDYFIGFQHRFGSNLAIDTTLQRYTYQGGEFGAGYDWTELQVAAHIGDHLTLMAAAGDNWIGRGEDSYVVEASYRYALHDRLTVFATLGQHFADGILRDNFAYREVGLSTLIANFGLQMSWADTVGTDPAPMLTRNRLSVTVSRSFQL